MKRTIFAIVAALAVVLMAASCGTPDKDFTFETDGDTAVITGYTGSSLKPVIPSKLNGRAVAAIATGAFQNKGLSAVTIPDSVKTIDMAAFAENKLTSVTIPDSVKTIDMAAFAGNQLTSVTIPDRVHIEMNAFFDNLLTSIKIGADVSLGTHHYPAFENDFDAYYNDNGAKAGTYTFANGAWSRR